MIFCVMLSALDFLIENRSYNHFADVQGQRRDDKKKVGEQTRSKTKPWPADKLRSPCRKANDDERDQFKTLPYKSARKDETIYIGN